MITRTWTLASLLLFCVGCGAPPPELPHSTETVLSAGGFHVSAEPMIDIGGSVDGQPILTDVSDATRLANGLIAVADKFADRIALFDSTGSLVRYLGRTGSGPGEFRGPEWVGECAPDTLTVYDAMASRLTTIDTAGRVISQRPLTPRPTRIACNRGGMFVMIAAPSPSDDSDTHPMLKSAAVVLDRAGGLVGSLGDVPVGSSALLGASAVIAMSDSGIIYGSAEAPSLDLYTFAGAQHGTRDVGMPRRTPTAANVDGWVESQIERVGRSANDSIIRVMLRRFPTADLMPAYRSVHVDERQNLWVVTSFRGDGFTELRVLPAHGGEPATLRFPSEVTVFEVRGGFLLGRTSDSTLVPRLVVYRAGSER
ncbi:MAG: hypothetical protein ABI542_08445 [Gemmatimonadota bacterium]